MSYVVNTAQQIRVQLRRGQLVVLESTTYPGTTDELVRGILEESGLSCGQDFFLAFSPEREDPGNASFNTATIPKIVGGVDRPAGDLAQASTTRSSFARCGSRAPARRRRPSSSRTSSAPSTSRSSTSSRSSSTGWASTSGRCSTPRRRSRSASCASIPGPGWGGHCIPLDPFYLSWKAREYGVTPKFIELAGEVNVRMPEYVIEKLSLALNDRRKAVRGKPRAGARARLQEGHRRSPREPGLRDHRRAAAARARRSAYHDPHVPKAPADALVAEPSADRSRCR